MASAAIGTMARPMDLTRVVTGLGVGVMCPAAPLGTMQGRTQGAPQEPTRPLDMDAAAEFIRLHRRECPEAGEVGPRLREIRREVELTGMYQHTSAELVFGARVAWRNSCRCIGRLYWQSLQVRDRRDVNAAADIAAECAVHLRRATNGGRIRPTITVFAPDTPGRPGPRIWNEQIVRYAGYQRPDGTVHGDPRNADLTGLALSLGWPGGESRFDVLPLVISAAGEPPGVFGLPRDAVLEVPVSHPRFEWFAELGLRWHAVPVITDMCLEIGGICYPAAPFNGWYMGTEIGARNLADCDRYNQLPDVATRMGLDLSSDRSLWRDRAMVELNVAVLHSFDTAGVTITDHHTESRRFLTHLAREERARRVCPADWSWIVPPISGSTTEVFHRYYDEADLRPNYVRHDRDLPGLHPGPG
jgi:nitric-oxide synthase, bacterial